MIGQRIKQARLAAGLSLDRVVSLLAGGGTALTKAALSKYERGISIPRASLLHVLAKALHVAPDFFLREHRAAVVWCAYRRRSRLGAKDRDRIEAIAEEKVDSFIWLRDALSMDRPKSFPSRIPVTTPEAAEGAAMQLRSAWGLGDLPVENLTETFEDSDGIAVDLTDEREDFDGMAGVANEAYPVLVTRHDVATDRKRFTMGHELGHLVMDTGEAATVRDAERLCDRFAGAFLVPRTVAYRELGNKRSHLSLPELVLLKEKHGLSVQAWLYRARDLGIIEEGHFNTLFVGISAMGLRKRELGECRGCERPARFELMVRRALAEGLIDREQAMRWCPNIREDVSAVPTVTEAKRDLSPRAVYALPKAQRDMVLREAAAALADIYQPGSDALVGDIWE
jgi:Zn-dependent peptidase ImmA (M78 family)/transcriptional regulator with XRE-family HTH domain